MHYILEANLRLVAWCPSFISVNVPVLPNNKNKTLREKGFIWLKSRQEFEAVRSPQSQKKREANITSLTYAQPH